MSKEEELRSQLRLSEDDESDRTPNSLVRDIPRFGHARGVERSVIHFEILEDEEGLDLKEGRRDDKPSSRRADASGSGRKQTHGLDDFDRDVE